MVAAANPRLAVVRHRLEALVDLSSGTGLEIGPLATPVVTSPPWDVRYADVFDTAHLKEQYRHDPNVCVEDIVDVHFVLSRAGVVRSLSEAAASDGPYKWAVASHVAEHVPDLIGWLADLASLLDDGARLFLMLPDRRFTFDARRPATTVGQLLEAHSRRDTGPSERAVYDHFRSVIPQLSPADLWAGASVATMPSIHTVEQAAAVREAALQGQYIDCHVWVFTPDELVEQLADLGELDLLDYTLDYLIPTRVDELEFTLVLRRLRRDASRDERMTYRRTALKALMEAAPLSAPAL
jgi:hypothetical protein